jgi:acetyltransferase-like isoleucine patch superfamily enzyme
MIRSLLEKIIRHRNPDFCLHSDISPATLFSFLQMNFWSLFRGWKFLFYGKNPKMALLGANVKFFNISKIRFGKYLKLGDHVFLSALGKEGIILGNNVGIGAFSRLVVSTTFNHPGEYIKLGNNVGIGEFAYLGGAGGLEIGDDCIVGQYFSCHPENHITEESNKLIRLQGVTRKGISIGPNCWIGSKVTILDGVSIGSGCIIAAGAVVTQSFPDQSVIGGVPSKLLKSRI